jgi:uncharacterized UPF0160 family protein
VGATFELEKKRFDHHQREFTETFYGSDKPNRTIKLSSAGLIYKHYGMQILQRLLPDISAPLVDLLFKKVRLMYVWCSILRYV